jgi:hypothetical protein
MARRPAKNSVSQALVTSASVKGAQDMTAPMNASVGVGA